MIRSYLGFDISDYRDPKIAAGIIYGSLGACADALPWFLVVFGLPYVLEGGSGYLAGILSLLLGGIGFVLGVICKKRALVANFDATYMLVSHARLKLANHLARLPLGKSLSQRDGAWAELMTAQFTLYQDIVTHVWGCVITGVSFPCLLWLLLATLSVYSAVIMLVTFPLALLSVPLAYTLLDRAAQKVFCVRKTAAVKVLECITGARDLCFFDPKKQREQSAIQSLDELCAESMRTEVAPAPALLLFSLLIYIGAAAAIGVTLIVCMHMGSQPVSAFLTILVTLRLATAMNEFGPYLAEMRFAGAIINRIREVLAEPQMPQVIEGQHPVNSDIELHNVSFGYDICQDVLHNISLCIPSGGMVAIVGASGSGKSTLAALITRLWDVRQGVIRIGGVDIRDMDVATLQRTVSTVLQDVVLFPMSVADNIRLGRTNADMAEVVAAAKAACIHERIMQLPNGYETLLESEEVVLSGGERQRIAIARAIIKNAPILILDEATSSLDLENEAAVQKALGNLLCGKTSFVIAHRLWTIQDADIIYVMENGRIAEQGTHAHLLGMQGVYAELWRAQSE